MGQSEFESDRGEEKESLRIEREKGLKVECSSEQKKKKKIGIKKKIILIKKK